MTTSYPSFATITLAELDALKKDSVTFCPTDIIDAARAWRLDVIQWCRKNGCLDENFYSAKGWPIPADNKSNCFPYAASIILDHLPKNAEVAKSIGDFVTSDNGDMKHYVGEPIALTRDEVKNVFGF